MEARYRSRLWAFGLLMLLGLTACGTTEQPAGGNTAELPAATPAADAPSASSTQAPAARMPTPALRQQRTAISPLPRPVKPAVASGTPTITSRADGWQVYRDEQAGFSVAFPADWSVSQTSLDESAAVARFGPASGMGIQVAVQPGDPPAVRQPERSSLVCERVVAGGLTGTRCVDSTTGRIATTLAGKGRTFIIATTGQGIDESVYRRVLDSFALVG